MKRWAKLRISFLLNGGFEKKKRVRKEIGKIVKTKVRTSRGVMKKQAKEISDKSIVKHQKLKPGSNE